MASTFPAKSQPLHNFTLPHLKWNKDGHSGGHHQRRRSIKSPSRRPSTSSSSPVRHSPLRDSISATPPRHQSPLSDAPPLASPRESPVLRDYLGKQSSTQGVFSVPFPVREWVKRSPIAGDPPLHFRRHGLASESDALAEDKGDLVDYQRFQSRNLKLDSIRSGVYSTIPEQGFQKFETKSKAKNVDVAGIKKSKILIKIPCKNNRTEEENPPEEPPKIDNKIEADDVREEAKINNNNNTDEETKIWNLRPRKPIRRPLNANGDPVKNNGSPLRNLSNKSGENGGSCDGGGQKKGSEKEKRKLSVFLSLSKEEIEEDIFALTGSKPARRPKKRAKSIQRQIDSLFPGSWLVSISADSYKVSENSLKG